MRMPSRLTIRRFARSWSRPGVATRMCALFAAFPCAETEVPPYTAVTRSPFVRPMSSNSSATCVASSLVGTRTSAEGRASAASRRWTIGAANARVLPDPVGDLARTSFPARASGMTSDWIENGV